MRGWIDGLRPGRCGALANYKGVAVGRMDRVTRGIVDVAFFCVASGFVAAAVSPVASMLLLGAGALAILVVMICERGAR